MCFSNIVIHLNTELILIQQLSTPSRQSSVNTNTKYNWGNIVTLRIKLFGCSNSIAVKILSITPLFLLDSFLVLFQLFFKFHNCLGFLIYWPTKNLPLWLTSSYIDEELQFSLSISLHLLIVWLRCVTCLCPWIFRSAVSWD